MKKFVFSMEKILNLRQFQQKEAEAELGKANAEVARIQHLLDETAQKRIQTIHSYDGATDIQTLSYVQNFLAFLDQKKEKLLEEIAQAQMVADEKREIVRECMKNTKVLEKLKENKLEEWKKDQIKQEDIENDDINNFH